MAGVVLLSRATAMHERFLVPTYAGHHIRAKRFWRFAFKKLYSLLNLVSVYQSYKAATRSPPHTKKWCRPKGHKVLYYKLHPVSPFHSWALVWPKKLHQVWPSWATQSVAIQATLVSRSGLHFVAVSATLLWLPSPHFLSFSSLHYCRLIGYICVEYSNPVP